VEKHCQELFPRLTERGFSVTVLGRKGYIPDETYQYKGVTIRPLWAPRKKSLEAICHTGLGVLWLAANRSRYDVLHIHAIGPSLLAPAARALGLRLVVTNHGPDYDRQKWGGLAKTMLRLGERLGSRYANAVITVSQHIRSLVLNRYGTAATYVPNGVNFPELVPAGPVLEHFGLTPGRYLLAVGRLVPEKGFHDLIEAFSDLSTDWKLVIVGGADHEDDYSRSLRQKASQTPGVVMTGFQKGRALGELYSQAGLFVLPSYHEGLPIVGLEAMSYQLPMVLSDIPANLEIAMEGELFSVGNVAALREKLQAVVSEPGSWRSIGRLEAKRKRLCEEFNWDVIADQTADVYRAVVGGKGVGIVSGKGGRCAFL
jgi:glycosyltransferase involved in cell wall biosynthesis